MQNAWKRSRNNIYYFFKVDFLELFDGPVSLKQDDPNLVRFILQKFIQHPKQLKTASKVMIGSRNPLPPPHHSEFFNNQELGGLDFFIL